jgi:putative ABC transport system permease protein
MRVNLSGSRYATATGQVGFYNETLDRIARLPIVKAAAVSTDLPLSGEQPFQGTSFQIEGRPPLEVAQRPQANVSVVSADFFRTIGIPLRNGRLFSAEDSEKFPGNIVVNEAFTRKILSGENPLGKRIITAGRAGDGWTIIGVVGDIRAGELGADPVPLIYRCICQGGSRFLSAMRILVRTEGDVRAAIRPVEAQVYEVDRNQPVSDVKSMEQRLSAALAPRRFQLMLLGTFAGMAVVLAAVGVYGIMSFLVSRRTREIGIRLAIGATPERVYRLMLRETAFLAIVGALAGIAGAWALTRYLESMLYGVSALDGPTFAVAAALLSGIAIAASLVPARRASRIDPIVALREE